jgi:ATP-dependent DNA ligase
MSKTTNAPELVSKLSKWKHHRHHGEVERPPDQRAWSVGRGAASAKLSPSQTTAEPGTRVWTASIAPRAKPVAKTSLSLAEAPAILDAMEDRLRSAVHPASLSKIKSMNKEYRPMLATLADKPFDSKEWVYETKWDGFRLIAELRRGSVRLFSRNGIDVQALRSVTEPCVIDGELVALDAKGRSRFQLLQNALRNGRTRPSSKRPRGLKA